MDGQYMIEDIRQQSWLGSTGPMSNIKVTFVGDEGQKAFKYFSDRPEHKWVWDQFLQDIEVERPEDAIGVYVELRFEMRKHNDMYTNVITSITRAEE